LSELPGLSVILATDAFSTIEPVVRRLRAQSVAEKLELVIVTPRPEALRREAADPGEFASLLIVGVDGLVPLTAARAAGVRAARIDYVNVARPSAWLLERYVGGLLDGEQSDGAVVVGPAPALRRRLAADSGGRARPSGQGATTARRAYGVPIAVYPALLLGAVVSAIGELVEYLGGPVAWAERRMTEYEIHRLRYLGA
jgi:hypothetical protein